MCIIRQNGLTLIGADAIHPIALELILHRLIELILYIFLGKFDYDFQFILRILLISIGNKGG